MEARMDWGHRFEMHRYLTLVRQKQYSYYDIILELPTVVDPILCAVVLLVREPELFTLKRASGDQN